MGRWVIVSTGARQVRDFYFFIEQLFDKRTNPQFRLPNCIGHTLYSEHGIEALLDHRDHTNDRESAS